MRKEFFIEAGGFDEEFVDVLVLGLEICKICNLKEINMILSEYRYMIMSRPDEYKSFQYGFIKILKSIALMLMIDVIYGKNAYFVYLANYNRLLYMNYVENNYVDQLAGSTLVFKRAVWDKIKFEKVNRAEDYFFLVQSLEAGFKLFSGDRFNYVYIRRDDREHTWKVDKEYFLDEGSDVNFEGDFRTEVVR